MKNLPERRLWNSRPRKNNKCKYAIELILPIVCMETSSGSSLVSWLARILVLSRPMKSSLRIRQSNIRTIGSVIKGTKAKAFINNKFNRHKASINSRLRSSSNNFTSRVIKTRPMQPGRKCIRIKNTWPRSWASWQSMRRRQKTLNIRSSSPSSNRRGCWATWVNSTISLSSKIRC